LLKGEVNREYGGCGEWGVVSSELEFLVSSEL